MQVRPFILSRAFWANTRYGIENGKIYAKAGWLWKTLDSSTELSRLRAPHAKGGLIGDVTFEMEGGGTDLKWSSVILPSTKKVQIETQIEKSDEKIEIQKGEETECHIPDNIEFSNVLLKFPSLPWAFRDAQAKLVERHCNYYD